VMQKDKLCTSIVSSRAAGVRLEASDQHCNMCWLHLHILISDRCYSGPGPRPVSSPA
jgi:hypothetical protein